MRPSLRTTVTLALALGLGTHGALAAGRQPDPLRPIIQCLSQGPMRAAEAKRLPPTVRQRPLLLPGRQLMLEVADGYGMKLYTPRGKLIGELTLELAAPGSFAAGRGALVAQLQAFAQNHPGGALPLDSSRHDGTEMVAVRQASLASPGPMAYLGFYRESAGLLVGGQWLKPLPPARAFSDLAGYESLRQEVEARVLGCLAAAG